MCPNDDLQDFLSSLKASRAPAGSVAEVLEILDMFCAAIQQHTEKKVGCVRVPSFVTNLGQEYRIVLAPSGGEYEHVLLRAHVPASGLPVNLDLYDEDLVPCEDTAALRRALKEFLQRDNTGDVIKVLATRAG